jgi:hypothetical protein
MLYRRKILLALIEVFGGSLAGTDFEKLLFWFGEYSRRRYYDFLPYKYGCFSFISYADKRVLIKQGLLKNSLSFATPEHSAFLGQIEPEDRSALLSFVNEVNGLRGRALVRKVYREYPHIATRSEILDQILSPAEAADLLQSACSDESCRIFTIGYEGKSIDSYLNALISNNVKLLVDVRRNALSMKYGFSKTKLRNYVTRASIGYAHIPGLGIESSKRKKLESPTDYELLFKRYASEMLPLHESEISRLSEMISKSSRVALTCFEAEPNSCHRHSLVEYMQEKNLLSAPVTHL